MTAPGNLANLTSDEIANRTFTATELEAMSHEQIVALCAARNIDATDDVDAEYAPPSLFIDDECLEYSLPKRQSDHNDEDYAYACRECELAHEIALRQREARIAVKADHD
jgi:hypothetical protein